jgi:hypothetical protein
MTGWLDLILVFAWMDRGKKLKNFNQLVLTTNSVALVRERTISTARPPLVGEVSANFWISSYINTKGLLQRPGGLWNELSLPAQAPKSGFRILPVFMCEYYVFVCVVQAKALRWADPPSKESYRVQDWETERKKTAKDQHWTEEPLVIVNKHEKKFFSCSAECGKN